MAGQEDGTRERIVLGERQQQIDGSWNWAFEQVAIETDITELDLYTPGLGLARRIPCRLRIPHLHRQAPGHGVPFAIQGYHRHRAPERLG